MVKRGGNVAIKRWIADQMKYRSCTIVLVGSNTANRNWNIHEIVKSRNDDMGVVRIYIHGLTDPDGYTSKKGRNPFDFITHGNSDKKLSTIVKCYDPAGRDSRASDLSSSVGPRSRPTAFPT